MKSIADEALMAALILLLVVLILHAVWNLMSPLMPFGGLLFAAYLAYRVATARHRF
ncbi:MAG: hypothetical protein ACYDH6_23440 [Acidimicrobiales bacterium]